MRPIRSARLSSSSTASTRAAAAGPGSPSLQAGHGGADDSPFASPVSKGRTQPQASTSSAGMTRSRSGRQVRPPAPRDRVGVNGHDNDDDDDNDDEVPVRRARSKRASLWNPRATPRKSSETNGKASSSRQSAHSSAASSLRKDDAAAKAAAASTEEARAKQEQEERKMLGKWAEEYYEIVEQLPLELHRSFTLMRELETKLQEKNLRVATQVKEYRDARIALRNLTPEQRTQMLKAEAERAQKEKAEAPALAAPSEAGRATSAGSQLDVQELLMQGSSTDADAEGEDAAEVYHELAGEAYVPQPYAYDLPLVPQVNQEAAPVSSASLSSESDALAVPPGAAADAEDVKMAEAGDDDDDEGGVAPTRAARLLLLSCIAQASSDALRIADEKIGLAVTAYEWVDRQIRRLDGDLQKSENGLLLGLRAGTEASRGLQDALGVSLDGSGDKDAPGRWDEVETLLLGHPANDRSAVAQRKGKKRGRKGASQAAANANVGEEEDDVNATTGMAIDPNEPTYCYCDQVSFGDMVACDNEDCPREWFHYHCVGFTQPPKGRWFCLFCAPAVGFKGAGTFPPDAPCLPEGLAKKSGVGGRKGKR